MSRTTGLVLFLALVVACAGDPLEASGVDCDPMAYQLDNEVWVLQGGARTRLSEGGLVGANPSLSSDAMMVAYVSGPQGG